MKLNWHFLVDRLKERSSWLGIIAFMTAAGVQINPEYTEGLVTAGVMAASVVAYFFPDK